MPSIQRISQLEKVNKNYLIKSSKTFTNVSEKLYFNNKNKTLNKEARFNVFRLPETS